MTAHTPGPWAWNDSGYYLMPVTPRPDVSAVHTILSPDGCVGYLLAELPAVLAEDAANRAVIEASPELLSVLTTLRDTCKAMDLEREADRPSEAQYFAAIEAADRVIAKASTPKGGAA